MAKPTAKIERFPIDPVKQREEDKGELLDALFERKASLEALIELIEKLDERGILDLLNGLVGHGDEVMGIAMRELNKPSVSDTLDHMMNLGAMVGRLDTKKLVGLTDRINAGLDMAEQAANSGERTTLFDLMKTLRDPDVNRAVTSLIGFLKGAGKTT